MIFVLRDEDDQVISDPSWGDTVLNASGFAHLAFMGILWISFFLKKGKFHV